MRIAPRPQPLSRHGCLLLCTLLAAAGCSRQDAPSATPARTAAAAPDTPASGSGQASAAMSRPAEAPGIAWKKATTDADVDAAFALARAENKPVFLYWGATWCPPCNQVQATLFNRQDVIERSRAFVPVYVDGDSPGAQKLGSRFKVVGYPTMVLFNPEGAELTRLPGEVDAQQYLQLLTLGMSAQRPVKAVLADARAGGQALSANDWKLLAFYSWETDEQQAVPKSQLPAVLKQLAAACPPDQTETAARLFLKAWAASDAKAARPAGADRERLLVLLRGAESSRVQMDVLSYNAVELVKVFSAAKTPQRQQLLETYDASLAGLANDVTLSRADRLTAQIARAQLVGIDAPQKAKVTAPEALLSDFREHVARADRETTDRYERQAVIPTAAYLLEVAGVPTEAEALLKANLAKSHAPYYLMLGLAGTAKRRGDSAEALNWYQQAFDSSEGPATRLQWGAAYLKALVDLSPQDAPRIERTAAQLFTEAADQPHAFYERSARSLQQVGEKLQAWRKQRGAGSAASIQRLQAQLDGLCSRQPEADGQRAACRRLLKA